MRVFHCLAVSAVLVLPAAAWAENWPGFRGPARQGVSSETGLPREWGPAQNVAWSTGIPGEGWSSPIVWDGRVFLTAAADEGASCRVLAVDASSGEILWNREVFRQELRKKREQNSYATPTPVTGGERVYAVFGDGSIAALTFEGEIAWVNRDYPHYSEHGLGASPILWKNLLIMPYDGSDPNAQRVGWKIPWDGARIVALEKSSGKLVWEGKRGKSRIAHVTPNVWTNGEKPQLISGAGDVVQGFDLETGERLWSIYSQGEGVVPSIVLGGGKAYTSSGFEASTIRAVRLGGRGDVTDTHIAWEQTRAVPHIPSFLYWEGILYTVHENGIAMALDPETGEPYWQERLEGSYGASPVLIEGRIYFLNEDCDTTLLAPGKEFRVLGSNELEGEMCKASMAVSEGRLFIRSAHRLFAISR